MPQRRQPLRQSYQEDTRIIEKQRELVAKLLPLPFSSIAYNKKTLAEFRALAISLGLKVDTNCIKCIPDLKKQIKTLMSKTEKAKTSTKKAKLFAIRKGIDVGCLGYIINSDTLTDEEALKMLKQNKAYLHFFVKYPKNWEELV